MEGKDIKLIFEILSTHIKNPSIELHYTNPFTLLIAVMLSAQSTDKGVNKVTRDLFKVIQTSKDLLALGQANLENAIKSINYFRNKAKHIMAASLMIEGRFNGQIPETQHELMELPGIGIKSANVILNSVFGQSVIGVDTHVFRVSHRLGLSHGKTPEKVSKDLEHIVPEELKKQAHHLLVLHGRYTCTAKKPKCGECPLQQLCPYFQKIKPDRESAR